MDLLPLLYILGISSSLAWGNVKTTAPEDLDGSGGSGDDEEDFSGSGMESVLVETVSPTQVSPLAPTVTQLSTAQKTDITIEKVDVENATQPHDLDLFGFRPVGKEPFEEGTTLEPTTHQSSTVESVDVKKHHHHHTTTPGTSIPAEVVLVDTTTGPTEVEKPFVPPKETTTSTPDGGDIDLVKEVVPTTEDSAQHVDHPETTSGLTSTVYAENEETTAGLPDIVEIPGFVDSVEKTTVTDEEHTRKHHHHHHHHNHTTTTATTTTIATTTTATTTTAILLDESDILIEMTTKKSDHLEPEDENQQGEATTTPTSEDKHHGHEHHHHKHHHHHTTTPGATQSTASEQDIGHTKEPKGRRVNVPPAETTTAVPVSKDEEPIGSTVQYNYTVGPVQDKDLPDSSEEESGDGPVEPVEPIDDLFFEVTASVDNRMAPAPGDGSAGASHGIMERKELLAGIIAGGLAGLLFAASLVAFVFYRMKKKDEGSYSLEEPKQSNGGYQKPREQREFYA
ncbi:syndecan-1 [Lithobates pipiens]